MESTSKKRKISHHDTEENEEEDDEEQKMEKFYALIKSIRDARERFFNTSASGASSGTLKMAASSDDDQNKIKRLKLALQAADEQAVVWKPSFQREDFMEQLAQVKKPLRPVSFATTSLSKEGTVHQKDQEAAGKDQLDLSLSL